MSEKSLVLDNIYLRKTVAEYERQYDADTEAFIRLLARVKALDKHLGRSLCC